MGGTPGRLPATTSSRLTPLPISPTPTTMRVRLRCSIEYVPVANSTPTSSDEHEAHEAVASSRIEPPPCVRDARLLSTRITTPITSRYTPMSNIGRGHELHVADERQVDVEDARLHELVAGRPGRPGRCRWPAASPTAISTTGDSRDTDGRSAVPPARSRNTNAAPAMSPPANPPPGALCPRSATYTDTSTVMWKIMRVTCSKIIDSAPMRANRVVSAGPDAAARRGHQVGDAERGDAEHGDLAHRVDAAEVDDRDVDDVAPTGRRQRELRSPRR